MHLKFFILEKNETELSTKLNDVTIFIHTNEYGKLPSILDTTKTESFSYTFMKDSVYRGKTKIETFAHKHYIFHYHEFCSFE